MPFSPLVGACVFTVCAGHLYEETPIEETSIVEKPLSALSTL